MEGSESKERKQGSQIKLGVDSGIPEVLENIGNELLYVLGFPTQNAGEKGHGESFNAFKHIQEIPCPDSFLLSSQQSQLERFRVRGRTLGCRGDHTSLISCGHFPTGVLNFW